MLLQKFFIYLCLCGVLSVSAEPIESIETTEANSQEDVLQLRQQLDQLRDVLLDQEDRISQQQKEIQKLRGDNEVLVHKIDQVQKQQQDIFLDMDKRLQALQSPPASPPTENPTEIKAEIKPEVKPETKDGKATTSTSPPEVTATKAAKTTGVAPVKAPDSALEKELIPPAPPPTEPVKKEVVEPKSPPDSSLAAAASLETAPKYPETSPAETEEQLHQRLMKLIDEGKERQAITGFEEFLQRYPQSKHADNAQYWLGESYYATGNYNAAIKAFNTLIVTHPQSPKYSQALLKVALSHYELREFVKARELLQRLRNDYVGTTAARLAERRLKKMTAEGH